jgi:hypothetical protein
MPEYLSRHSPGHTRQFPFPDAKPRDREAGEAQVAGDQKPATAARLSWPGATVSERPGRALSAFVERGRRGRERATKPRYA